MDTALLNSLAGLGVGGLLAAIVMNWKRQDDLRYGVELKGLNERMLVVVDGNTKAMLCMTAAVEALCSLQKMEERLGALERKLSRKVVSGDGGIGHT
jgi:hypothetical protein